MSSLFRFPKFTISPATDQSFAVQTPDGKFFKMSMLDLLNFASNPSGAKNYFVDTTREYSGDGLSPGTAFLTMAEALAAVTDHGAIYFVGKVREQLVAPLGVQGVKIIGSAGGNIRDDDGAKWYTPASPVAGKALIEIREQGWEFHNFLMTPDATGGAAIKAHRAENATYPDSSHFVCRGMRIVGAGGTPIGIEDVGGNHHYLLDGCEFQTLTTAVLCSSTSVAVPLRNTIRGCKFLENTNDIDSAMSYGLIEGNYFFTDSTKTVVIAGGGHNMVVGNVFPNAVADIDPAHGYDGETTDIWAGNIVTDQAAFAFGNPA